MCKAVFSISVESKIRTEEREEKRKKWVWRMLKIRNITRGRMEEYYFFQFFTGPLNRTKDEEKDPWVFQGACGIRCNGGIEFITKALSYEWKKKHTHMHGFLTDHFSYFSTFRRRAFYMTRASSQLLTIFDNNSGITWQFFRRVYRNLFSFVCTHIFVRVCEDASQARSTFIPV